jgi:hypothetical protein
VRVEGGAEPRFELIPTVLATIDGRPIEATATAMTRRSER